MLAVADHHPSTGGGVLRAVEAPGEPAEEVLPCTELASYALVANPSGVSPLKKKKPLTWNLSGIEVA